MDMIIVVALAFLMLIFCWRIASNYKGNPYLCNTCKFNNDTDCQKVERPKAVSCYSYLEK
jgi:hypothetical protein